MAWLSRALRGSGGEEHAATEQVEAGAPVHLPLQQLEPGDPALGLAVAPRRRERRPDGGAVLLEAGREGLDRGHAARPRVARITRRSWCRDTRAGLWRQRRDAPSAARQPGRAPR